jgi:hypothetical protein
VLRVCVMVCASSPAARWPDACAVGQRKHTRRRYSLTGDWRVLEACRPAGRHVRRLHQCQRSNGAPSVSHKRGCAAHMSITRARAHVLQGRWVCVPSAAQMVCVVCVARMRLSTHPLWCANVFAGLGASSVVPQQSLRCDLV